MAELDDHVPGVAVAVSLFTALGGSEPSLDRASEDRLKRLLKPLLSSLAKEVRSHRLTCDWPPRVWLASSWRSEESRLTTYLKELRRSPRHVAFQVLYGDWVATHPDLADLSQGPGWIPAEQLLIKDGPKRERVSPIAFSTVWAIQFSRAEIANDTVILAILCEVDALIAGRSESSTALDTAEIRKLVKDGRLEGERRGELRSKDRLERASEVGSELRSQIARLSREHTTLQDEYGRLKRDASNSNSQAEQARGQLRRTNDDLAAALARIPRVRQVLREERAISQTLEGRIARLTEEVLGLRSKLNETTEKSPSGSRGLYELLTQEIENESLKRDTTQGASRASATKRYSQLKKVRSEFLAAYPEFVSVEELRPKTVGRKAKFSVRALGGGSEIGASSYLLELDGLQVLVDCGIRIQERDISRLGPDLPDLDEIQAVLVTHAHTDHIGWLPTLIAKGFGGDIYCTRQTNDLVAIMLKDSRKQLERMMAVEYANSAHTQKPITPQPYTRQDLERVLFRLRPVGFDEPVRLSPQLGFTFVPAGHILGAASVVVEGGGRRVFFTGDFSMFAQESVWGARWPDDGLGFDLVVTESTYGDRNREPRGDAIDSLVRALQETIERGGTAIVPSFALGRAQEVLSIVARAMRQGDLTKVPVWIDGMTESIDYVYEQHGKLNLPENFHHVRNEGFESEDIIAKAALGPNIIVSTSGMLSGGPVVEYASRLLPDGRNRLFFCGYQDEEQPGAKLLRLASDSKASRRVTVQDQNGKDVLIVASAKPERFSLSAHSDQAEIKDALIRLKPKHVMLVHGDDQARQGLLDCLTSARVNASLQDSYEVAQE